MDFNLGSVENDIARAKAFFMSGGSFGVLEKLGSGEEGQVRAFGDAAVKEYWQMPKLAIFNSDLWQEKMLKQSEKGMKREINFAPVLSTEVLWQSASKGKLLTFAPRLHGSKLVNRDWNATTDELAENFRGIANVGVDGLEKFFEDCHQISGIGFYTDFGARDNFILTNSKEGERHISIIDYRLPEIATKPSPEDRQAINADALRLILGAKLGCTRHVISDIKEVYGEVLNNAEKALSRIRYSDDAKIDLNAFKDLLR